MYRSVLVPLDGSSFAEHALPLALSIACRASATLNVVQVHVPFNLMYADSMAPGGYEAETKMLEQERGYLDEIVKRVASLSPVPVTSTQLEGPVIAETLSEHAAATGADLIVMTTHGRGPLSRFWLGSVADELVRRATMPILLVRPSELALDLTSDQALRHILVPLDGSALAEQVLEPARALGGLMQAAFTLVRAYGPVIDVAPLTYVSPYPYLSPYGYDVSAEQLQLRAQEYLNRMADGFNNQGFNVQTYVVLGQHPAPAILDAAQSLGVNLIALETHGRRGLPRLLLGSVADKVIRGACTPVLVHRSPAK